jgi:hypothetical protein
MLDRRRFAAAAAAAVFARPALGRGLDLADPAEKLRAYVRLRIRDDGKPVFQAYRATIFAKIDGEPAVACFDVEGCNWSRATRVDDATWALDNVEAGYYLDRTTGRPLDVWRNPINGLDCKIKHYRSFQHSIATADTVAPKNKAELPPGAEYRGVVPPAAAIGDQVWMSEDLFVKLPNKPRESFADPLEYTGPFTTASSLATWTGKLSDLADPRRAFVPATLSYQTANSWRPFMRMGTTPGVFMWRMYGVKMPTRDSIPAALRERVVGDYPDFFERL